MPHRSSSLHHSSNSSITTIPRVANLYPKKSPTRTVSRAAKKSPKPLITKATGTILNHPCISTAHRAGIMRQEVASLAALPRRNSQYRRSLPSTMVYRYIAVWYMLAPQHLQSQTSQRFLAQKSPRQRCVSNFTSPPPLHPHPATSPHLVFWGIYIKRSERVGCVHGAATLAADLWRACARCDAEARSEGE